MGLDVWVGLSYCDGGWNSVTMLKRGALTRAALNHALEQHRSERGGNLNITSPLYVGGVPAGLQHPALHQHSLLHGQIHKHMLTCTQAKCGQISALVLSVKLRI